MRRTEDVLQRETLTRSALETKKLELMSEISGLKLRQAAIERENINLRKKLNVNDPNNSNKRNSSSELDTNNKTTIQTFGTLPRSSRNKLRSSNANSKAAAAAAPLETHFNVRSSQISEENSPPNWFQRKISNAHSGSAPNLAPDDKNVKMRYALPLIYCMHLHMIPLILGHFDIKVWKEYRKINNSSSNNRNIRSQLGLEVSRGFWAA